MGVPGLELLEKLGEFHRSQGQELLLAEAADYAIFVLDADGVVRCWNEGAERFKGYLAHEIVGCHYSCFFTPEDRAAGDPERALAAARAVGRYEGEGWRVRKDDSLLWAHVRLDAIRDGDDAGLIGYAKILRDLTERRRAEEALARAAEVLEESERLAMAGRLASGIIHDFNNLLAVIRSCAALLARTTLPRATQDAHVQTIATTAERAAGLTDRLLGLVGRRPPRAQLLEVIDVLDGMVPIMEATLGAAIPLSLQSAEAGLCVQVDRSELEAAILNMAVNARDAMPAGGRLSITVRPAGAIPPVRRHPAAAGDFVAIEVEDVGEGIAAEALPHIFEAFYSTKPAQRGTGLGLNRVHGFAREAGGQIDVASHRGRGTCFTLYLPRSPVAERPTPPARRPEAVREPGKQGSLLLVEDNEIVGRLTVALLRELGQSVRWARDGRAAIDLIAEYPGNFDLVFSDFWLPGISGLDLAREVRQRWPWLVVVLTSGDPAAMDGYEDEGVELLPKPFSQESVRAMLRRHGYGHDDA